MRKSDFEQRLLKATARALAWARRIVVEPLPETCRYVILPNQSYDGNPLIEDQEVFPGDSLPLNRYNGPLEVDDALSYLWRNSKIPEWINISVDYTDGVFTRIVLHCCGRYSSLETPSWVERSKVTDNPQINQRREIAPFSVRYPILPKGWRIVENKIPNLEKSIELNGRFSLNETNGIYQ